jgi:prepilin signal peptidase PulO-like enzyme (type II secretory pathway)
MYIIYGVTAYIAGIAGGIAIAYLAKKDGIRLIKKDIKYTALLCAVCAFAFAIALRQGFMGDTIIPTEFISCFVTVFFMAWLATTDFTGFMLPNNILLAWLVCRLFLMSASGILEWSPLIPIQSALGAIVIGLLFLLMYYVSKRTLGGGDIKLSFVLGLSLTLTNIFNAVFFGLIICTLFAGVCLLAKKLNRKDFLPLGPFLFIGTLIAYLL